MARSSCLLLIAVALAIASSICFGSPINSPMKAAKQDPTDPLDLQGLVYLGKTETKELYITEERNATFYYALGFGCNFVYDAEHNLALASIQTLEEVALVNEYFLKTQPQSSHPELVWTSGMDRVGSIRAHWASTGEEITKYPTQCQGDWSPGQGVSPTVANYTCIAIWRNCDREGHGATIPGCEPSPHGTWFTPRPCDDQRRYICERRL